ncbi:MAG TPA: ImmA/IrrE family metallo-endopeptidase, partial [Nocardioides sp.]|nr:ImmA/IrrE family metallo-endopeptidase [Nocardioides sp.]
MSAWLLSVRPATLGRVTPDRLDQLFQHCADLGIDVEWRDLGEWRRGEYRRDDRLIVLNPRLTGRQVVACLAHELGHARFGHGCSSPA